MTDLAFDQPDIAIEAQQAFDDGLRVGHLQADARFRVLPHVFGNGQCAKVVADGQRCPHGQRRQRAAPEAGFDFPGLIEQLFRQRQHGPPGSIEMQRLADAIEERAIELALQFDQRVAGRRLRHAQMLGGARHVLFAGDGGENFDLAQTEFHIDLVNNNYTNYPLI